jgi:hypothetical protein
MALEGGRGCYSRKALAQLCPGFDLLEVLDDIPAVLVEDPVADQPKRRPEDAAPGIRLELTDPNHLDPAAAAARGRCPVRAVG